MRIGDLVSLNGKHGVITDIFYLVDVHTNSEAGANGYADILFLDYKLGKVSEAVSNLMPANVAQLEKEYVQRVREITEFENARFEKIISLSIKKQ